jgi:hypothetical protein
MTQLTQLKTDENRQLTTKQTDQLPYIVYYS